MTLLKERKRVKNIKKAKEINLIIYKNLYKGKTYINKGSIGDTVVHLFSNY